MEALSLFEGQFLLWLQGMRVEALNPVLTFITHLGDFGALWIGLALLMICFKKTRRVGVTSAVSILISFIVANLILKPLVARTRPYELIEGLVNLIEDQPDKSFPSGHATNALACAWVMFRMMDKKYGVPALVLALVICFTRLYVGVHYPTDVLAGILVGVCAAEIAMRLVKKIRSPFLDAGKPAKKKGKKKGKKKKKRKKAAAE